jgi:ribonuclease BN (tRNA processing enzyme)
MTKHVLAAYRQDVEERIHGLEPANDKGWETIAHEVRQGQIYQDENVAVEAFPVRHGSWRAFGYRFQTPDRTIVISGDTAPTEAIVAQSRGCDVLLHEVYPVGQFEGLPPEWQRYHAQVHTSTHELARIAAEAQPGLLVLYHQLFWGASDRELLDEIAEHYAGPVVSACDLDVY